MALGSPPTRPSPSKWLPDSENSDGRPKQPRPLPGVLLLCNGRSTIVLRLLLMGSGRFQKGKQGVVSQRAWEFDWERSVPNQQFPIPIGTKPPGVKREGHSSIQGNETKSKDDLCPILKPCTYLSNENPAARIRLGLGYQNLKFVIN